MTTEIPCFAIFRKTMRKGNTGSQISFTLHKNIQRVGAVEFVNHHATESGDSMRHNANLLHWRKRCYSSLTLTSIKVEAKQRGLMKAIVATFVLLAGLGWISTNAEISGVAKAEWSALDYGEDSWRRTADGWEDARTWRTQDKPSVDIRGVHPTVVATFTFFACLGGLVAFCPSLSAKHHTRTLAGADSDDDTDRSPTNGASLVERS